MEVRAGGGGVSFLLGANSMLLGELVLVEWSPLCKKGRFAFSLRSFLSLSGLVTIR